MPPSGSGKIIKTPKHRSFQRPGPSLERLNPAEPELRPSKDGSGISRAELRELRGKLAELQEKVAELSQANSDMEYLLASAGVATFFLDRQMNLTRFTPAAADIFGLTLSDVGFPFRHLAGNIDCPSFVRDAETGHPGTEQIVATPDRERCFLLRILPYRTQQGCIDGIMVTLSDVTEQKRMEHTLKESGGQVRQKLESILAPEGEIGSLELGDIIDAGALQSLVDDFHELTGMPMSLTDMNGKVLVGVGWQKICTQFHRVHPDTCRNCIESDLQLSAGVPLGEYKLYKCKNSMWDVATPVMLGDRQLGNLFMGQFFFEDEPLDYQLFRAQARAYRFDESEYLKALEAVPRLSRKSLNTCMTFFMKLAGLLSKLSYSNLKLARSLSQRDALMQSLFQSEQRLQLFIEHAPAALAMFDTGMRYLSVSHRWLAAYGLGERDLIGASHYDIFPELTEALREAHRRGLAGEVLRGTGDRFERADGSVQWVRWEVRPWRDAAGTIGGIVIFSDDITELQKAEDILRQLEQQVKERTHSLTESNEKLQQEIYRRRQIEIELLHKNQRLESMAIELSLAEERERDRIAGELHDQVGQRLILGKMKLGALASQVQSDSWLDDIEELDQIIGLSIQDIRSLTFQLRPPLLATAGLEAALRWLGEEFQEKYGHKLSYSDDNKPKPLRFETRSTVFQAAREMLINTVKHAGATHIEINIRREAEMLQLCLSDNGRGFDLTEARMKKSNSGGFGLSNVQRRIEHLGGGVIIQSRPGNGTQITIVVPLDLPQ